MAIGTFRRATIYTLEADATGMACEDVQTVIDVAVTGEALAVAFLSAAHASAMEGTLPLTEEQMQAVAAAHAVEQAHFDILSAAGATPMTTTFTLPDPAVLSDLATFLTTLITLEEVSIAAYMTAAQIFSSLGQHDLVDLSIQIGAAEGDHRALARFNAIVAGIIDGVPDNDAFSEAMFPSMSAVAQTLMDMGFIGGSGVEISYPGPTAPDYTGIVYLTP